MAAVEDTHWWYHALHDLIADAVATHAPSDSGRILDAGCGTGAVLKRVETFGHAVGVDLSDDALGFCRARGLRDLVRGDVNALPFASESFETVISSSVLYHQWVTDVAAALRDLRRVLKPGGRLVLNLPAYTFLRSPHDDAVLTARRFRKTEVRRLLEGCGFRVERITYWTTLLFPAALIARTLGASSTGQDFDAAGGATFRNRLLSTVMAIELALVRRLPMPFGVAIFAVAERSAAADRLAR